MQKNRVIAVIPARFGATRLPGKPLADIHGKPMIQWVYEASRKARGIDRVIVATDDERIMKAVQAFGGEARMTPESCASGTDRVAAIADQLESEIYLNVQGDEPLIEPATIEAALRTVTERGFEMGSAMTRLQSREELEAPSVVKALVEKGTSRAIYFSRYPIPYSRQAAPENPAQYACFRHLGLYVYRRETLMKIRSLAPSPIELGESLEQLRALENGIGIGLATVDSVSIGIDTPADLDRVRQLLENRK